MTDPMTNLMVNPPHMIDFMISPMDSMTDLMIGQYCEVRPVCTIAMFLFCIGVLVGSNFNGLTPVCNLITGDVKAFNQPLLRPSRVPRFLFQQFHEFGLHISSVYLCIDLSNLGKPLFVKDFLVKLLLKISFWYGIGIRI